MYTFDMESATLFKQSYMYMDIFVLKILKCSVVQASFDKESATLFEQSYEDIFYFRNFKIKMISGLGFNFTKLQ